MEDSERLHVGADGLRVRRHLGALPDRPELARDATSRGRGCINPLPRAVHGHVRHSAKASLESESSSEADRSKKAPR